MALADENVESGLHPVSRTKLVLGWLSKKTILLVFSLALLIFLILLFVADTAAWRISEEVNKTTQGWTFGVLLLHAVLLYASLLAFVFCTKSGGRWSFLTWLSFLIAVASLVVFVLRILLEIRFLGYRDEKYHGVI